MREEKPAQKESKSFTVVFELPGTFGSFFKGLENRPPARGFQLRFQHHRKRGSVRDVSGCKTARTRLRARLGVPQTTEWQRIGSEIDAAMIFGRADLINMFYFAHISTRFSSKIICVVNRRVTAFPSCETATNDSAGLERAADCAKAICSRTVIRAR